LGQAWAQTITLGQSTQTITLTGIGANASGDGTSLLTWSDCSFDGTKTNCTLSGPFTGLGPGGSWDLALSYPGQGPSPVTAITQPGSDLFSVSLSSGTVNFVFNESDGTSVTFAYLTGDIFFIPGQTACTGNPVNCGPGAVGLTPGATETGPVNGTFNPTPTIQAVITASSYGGFASIAPGTWIEIYGVNVATTTGVWGSANFHGNNAPTALGGTTVTVGGQPAFIDYVSPAQVNVQVSSDVGTASQPVVVTTVGGASLPYPVTVDATLPGLLAPSSFNIHNKQYAVALFSDGFYVLPPGLVPGVASKRAVPGDTIVLYGIGFGPTTPDNPAGVIVQDTNALNTSMDVSIGGVPAQVQYAGLTATFVGLYQFNVVVPDVPASDTTPLTFKLGGTPGTQTLYLFIGN
jgi:uncharacterized protein (TIGR03437 family)